MSAAQAPALRRLDPAADAARLQQAVRNWQRRSHLIRFCRRALPVLMVVILAALAVTVLVQTLGRTSKPEETLAVRMVNPRFQGRDDRGRAFILSADQAQRDAREFQRILLKSPVLELQTQADRPPMRVTSRSGVYMENTQVMTLEGDVRLAEPTGWRFATERAVVDTRRDTITGDKPIQGVGPTQRISGDTYAIYNRGERVIIRGNVRSTVNGGG
jgi:lipopolysaccharide export system protein LptC